MHLLGSRPRELLRGGRRCCRDSDHGAAHARRDGAGGVQSEGRGTRPKVSDRDDSTRMKFLAASGLGYLETGIWEFLPVFRGQVPEFTR